MSEGPSPQTRDADSVVSASTRTTGAAPNEFDFARDIEGLGEAGRGYVLLRIFQNYFEETRDNAEQLNRRVLTLASENARLKERSGISQVFLIISALALTLGAILVGNADPSGEWAWLNGTGWALVVVGAVVQLGLAVYQIVVSRGSNADKGRHATNRTEPLHLMLMAV